MIVNVLTITFANILQAHEIPLFRGAIVNALDEKNILFHNHSEEGFRYSYPLIQYKSHRGRATIVCIGQGTEAIGEFFASGNFDVAIGTRNERLQLERVEPRRCNIQVWQQEFDYRLRRWVALNSENYKRYQACISLTEKCKLLEAILRGNILSMGRGVGIEFDKQVKCAITQLREPFLVTMKDTRVTAFDVVFRSNVSLPAHIGLGKHASMNSGIVYPMQRVSK